MSSNEDIKSQEISCDGRTFTKQCFYRDNQIEKINLWEAGCLCAEEFYRNGKREGKSTFWNGEQLYIQQFYKNDKLEGTRKEWHKNGRLHVKEFYQNGELEGKSTYWEKNGHFSFLTFYRNGKVEGECQSVFPTGYRNNCFFRNDAIIDISFTKRKKLVLLRFKRLLKSNNQMIDLILISDLVKMIN